MTKILYNQFLAFEVENHLIGLYPNAIYIRVDCNRGGGITTTCIAENGEYIDASGDVVRFLNQKIEPAT